MFRRLARSSLDQACHRPNLYCACPQQTLLRPLCKQVPHMHPFGRYLRARPDNEMYTLSGGAAAPQTPGDVRGGASPPHTPRTVGLRPPCPTNEGKWGSNIIIVCQRYDLPNRIRYFDFLPHIRRVSLPKIRRVRPGFQKTNRLAGRFQKTNRLAGRVGPCCCQQTPIVY